MARPRRTRRPYGQGTVYEKRPGQWVVSWREDGERRYSQPLPSRDLAEKVRAKIAHDRMLERAGLPPDADSIPPFSFHGDHWLERHKGIHRSSGDDASRWKCHVRPALGHLRPADIDAAVLRKFIEAKLRELDPATVGHCVKLVSRIFSDLMERPRETGVSANPVRSIPRSVRRMYRPRHDPKTVPYLENLEDVERLLKVLADPFKTMYAVGVYAMLRTGEVLGVHAEDVDIPRRLITVRRQVQWGRVGPLKDEDTRIVPIQTPLLPLLAARKLAAGQSGPLFPTTRQSGGGRSRAPSRFISIHTLHDRFKAGCTAIGRADVLEWVEPFYQATRHTGASHWIAGGGNIGTLASIMGHSTTWVTERYAHLRPGLFAAEDYDRMTPVGSRMAPGGRARRAHKPGARRGKD